MTTTTQPKIKSFTFEVRISSVLWAEGSGVGYMVRFYGQRSGEKPVQAQTTVMSKIQALDLIRQLARFGLTTPYYFSITPESKEAMRNSVRKASQLPDTHSSTDLRFFAEDNCNRLASSLADNNVLNVHEKIEEDRRQN